VSIGGPLAINSLCSATFPYDPKKDLSLITMLVTQRARSRSNPASACTTLANSSTSSSAIPQVHYGSIAPAPLSQLAMEAMALKGRPPSSCTYPTHLAASDTGADPQQSDGLPAAISIVPQLGGRRL